MKKKVISVIMVVMALFSITAPVLANNHWDIEWGGNLPRLKGNFYTGASQKQDDSYSYISLEVCGKGGINAWLLLSNGKNCDSPKRNVQLGSTALISNYAYENNKNKPIDVKMAIESDYLNPVNIEAFGHWSPDSI